MEQNNSEIILYQTEDKKTRIEVRLQDETVWLTQKLMAELFDKDVRTINEHIRNIFDEGELQEMAVIRKNRITAADGKSYDTMHYNLDVIISVGYRVKSHRGTQFRIWATQRLKEFIIKGFTLDDDRLQGGQTKTDYFDELIERVRAIRASEKNFYRKITDIYATSADYSESATITREFYATVQNKFHYAIHGHTAAEVVVERADASKPNMGLTSWKGPRIRKSDVTVAKNYLTPDELKALNLIVDQYLSFAELQAQQRKKMYMQDWASKLNDFLKLNDRAILSNAGKISHALSEELATREFEKFEAQQRRVEAANPVSDFDKTIKQIQGAARRPPKPPSSK